MVQLLVDKYFPKNFDEFIGNVEVVDYAKKWVQEWESRKKQKPLLFFGQSGAGKTCLAYLIAKQFGWQIFEMNASDLRTKDVIEKVAGAAATNATLSQKRRLILIDEVDGLQSADRGGAEAIFSVIKQASNPIILTANDIYSNRKLVPLRSLTTLKEFKKINYLSIAKRLREIAELEGMEFDPDAVKELAKNSGGDFRSALLDLESLAPKVKKEDVENLFVRQRKEKIFPVMTQIFKGHSAKKIQEAVMSSEVSGELLFRWIEENIPRQFDSKDSAKAFERLSKADIFNGRIFRRQHYRFLKYSSALMSQGVGLSRSKDYYGWTPFQFPTLLTLLSASISKRELKKKVASKIAKKTHISRKRAMGEIPFIQLLAEEKKLVPFIAYFFEFDDKELAFILSTKPITKKVKNAMKESDELRKKIISRKTMGGQSVLLG